MRLSATMMGVASVLALAAAAQAQVASNSYGAPKMRTRNGDYIRPITTNFSVFSATNDEVWAGVPWGVISTPYVGGAVNDPLDFSGY